MQILIDFSFLESIKFSNLLTFFALLLAYFAYIKSINDRFESWESLLLSMNADLDSQKAWLSAEYKEETYKDKMAYSPAKIIYPLAFESLKEIIRRGASDLSFSDKFIKNASIFYERIECFNKLLEQQRLTVTNDPVLSQKTIDLLNEIGVCDCSVSFEKFIEKLEEIKKQDLDSYNLAKRIFSLNKAIHVNIISSKEDESGLHYNYNFFKEEISTKINNLNRIKPWYVKYHILIVIFSTASFVFAEIFLK